MNIVLFDAEAHTSLLPLTFARPVGDLRVGSLTIAEKWAKRMGGAPVSFWSVDYLQALFPLIAAQDNLLVDGSIMPNLELVSYAHSLPASTVVYSNGKVVMARVGNEELKDLYQSGDYSALQRVELPHLPITRITHPSDIFSINADQLRDDYELLSVGRKSAPLPDTNLLIGPKDQLFIEGGVTMEGCTINCTDGPVYIGKDAVVLEGALLRGPLSINEGTLIKMGAKIYGGTTIGPHCRAGGEVNNVVMQAHSNKGHDGFLGNAVIGEWCNLGADTNASNLKNDYGEVKVWSYAEERLRPTGLQFHGLIMGDHSKTGINTMFNTGTVVGFSSNVYGSNFPPTYLPSFSWGGAEGLTTYRLDKAMATAERVMARRGIPFGQAEQSVFEVIFRDSEKLRKTHHDTPA